MCSKTRAVDTSGEEIAFHVAPSPQTITGICAARIQMLSGIAEQIRTGTVLGPTLCREGGLPAAGLAHSGKHVRCSAYATSGCNRHALTVR